MTSINPETGDDGLPINVIREIDILCDEFEAALANEVAIRFEPYALRVTEVGRKRLLKEMCGIAVDHLRVRGIRDVAGELLAANSTMSNELLPLIEELSKVDLTQTFLNSPNGSPDRGLVGHHAGRGLHIRCPHCSSPVELTVDTPFDVVSCGSCGNNFSLVDRAEQSGSPTTLKSMGRFDLIARLGVGGFGTVWKARDTELDRVVAIKIPRHGQLNAHETELFFREARAAAQLRHPNIVPVHEVGRENDTIFIVSDFIQGTSLSDRLKIYRPGFRETAVLVATIAESLDHAHRNGVIHRDLKPSNVMIDELGEPHVMDFGLAKREAEEIAMTVDGQILGTPAYMSPEQASGNSQWVDRRTDVYSLGVMLFELLTGELPFHGSAQMQVHSRLIEDAPSARTLNRYIPVDLATICAKCLERESVRRYETAKQVADELKRYLNHVPIHARPLSYPDRAYRWVKRKPLLASLVGLILSLSIAGPTAAIVIAGQNKRLNDDLLQRDRLVVALKTRQEAYEDKLQQLTKELDIEAGRESPWQLWGSAKEKPPRQILALDLYDHSEHTLNNAESDESLPDWDKVRALVTLGILENLVEKYESSAKHYSDAVALLRRMASERPADAGTVEKLAKTLDDFRRITKLDRSQEIVLLEESRSIKERLAKLAPTDLQRQIQWFEAEMASALGPMPKDRIMRLNAAQMIKHSLASQWPQRLDQVCRLACFLNGEEYYLTDSNENSR